MREKRQYIDDRTGLIVSEYTSDFPDALNDEGYRFPSHKLGARMFAGVEFPKLMSDAEIGKMARLARRYMIAATNMLGYRDGREIKAYTGVEIAELSGYRDRQGRRFISKMVRLHVIQRINTNSGAQFYINPAYFMANGKRLSLDLFLLFRSELTPLLPSWVMIEFLRQANNKAILSTDANSEAERIITG
jgi:hypothetical protein